LPPINKGGDEKMEIKVEELEEVTPKHPICGFYLGKDFI